MSVQRQQPTETTGKQTASGAVFAGSGTLKALLLYTDGSNDASLVVYDSLTATGKIVREVHAKGTDGKGPFGNENAHVHCRNGCYAELTGNNAYYIVDYF